MADDRPHRSTRLDDVDPDSPPPRLRIKYEAPLPWLIGLIGIGIAQAAAMYHGQQRQGELIAAQSDVIKDLGVQVKALVAQIGAKDVKDVQHDLQIADHERRITSLEQHLKGRP